MTGLEDEVAVVRRAELRVVAAIVVGYLLFAAGVVLAVTAIRGL